LIAISVLQKKATLKSLLRNWLIVYFANFLGALILVWLIYLSSSWASTGGLVGAASLKVAYAKVNLSFVEAFSRGILCNWIVCLAFDGMCFKHVIGKLFAIFFPITIFVASGYEHSVANMFFIPKGLLMKNSAEVIAASGLTPEQLSTLNLKTFLINNLVPVTLGNIIGVVIFVAFLFWVVYLRKNED
jgi:formate/nitrite transporter